MIADTIDVVQSEVLSDRMPAIALLDRLLGPIDEMLMSHLITNWRETVWRHAMRLVDCGDGAEREDLVAQVEADVLAIAERIR